MYITHSDLKGKFYNETGIEGKFIHGDIDGNDEKNVLCINLTITPENENIKWGNSFIADSITQDAIRRYFDHYTLVRQNGMAEGEDTEDITEEERKTKFVVLDDKPSRITKMQSVKKGEEYLLRCGETRVAKKDIELYSYLRMVNLFMVEKSRAIVKEISIKDTVTFDKKFSSAREKTLHKACEEKLIEKLIEMDKKIASQCIEKNYKYNSDGIKAKIKFRKNTSNQPKLMAEIEMSFESIVE